MEMSKSLQRHTAVVVKTATVANCVSIAKPSNDPKLAKARSELLLEKDMLAFQNKEIEEQRAKLIAERTKKVRHFCPRVISVGHQHLTNFTSIRYKQP